MNKSKEIIENVADYYSKKVNAHGDTPKGVDWNNVESQVLRFKQLSKIIALKEFSINDLGCGYGAYLDYLLKHAYSFKYFGLDVSEAMIVQAKNKFKNLENAQFFLASEPRSKSDYTVASGIFNVRLKHDDASWQKYLVETLDVMNSKSQKGFAFNCLTSYSDQEKKRNYLYYTDPCEIFDLCKKKYSKNVSILHDYDLYEFTVLVRK